jgi:hypothetical protein
MASERTHIPDPPESIVTKEAMDSVTEIREIREHLSARFDQNIDRLADHATEVAATWKEKLGLHSAAVVITKK